MSSSSENSFIENETKKPVTQYMEIGMYLSDLRRKVYDIAGEDDSSIETKETHDNIDNINKDYHYNGIDLKSSSEWEDEIKSSNKYNKYQYKQDKLDKENLLNDIPLLEVSNKDDDKNVDTVGTTDSNSNLAISIGPTIKQPINIVTPDPAVEVDETSPVNAQAHIMTAYAVPTLVAPIEPIGTSNNMNVDMSNNIVKISNPITTTVNAIGNSNTSSSSSSSYHRNDSDNEKGYDTATEYEEYDYS